jgi:hypothetical protein
VTTHIQTTTSSTVEIQRFSVLCESCEVKLMVSFSQANLALCSLFFVLF